MEPPVRPLKLGQSTAWTSCSNDESSVIVKLNGERSIAAILREIAQEYRTSARPNPLGIDVPKGADRATAPIEFLIDRLHPDLKGQAWQGILVINPKADISQDEVLRDLAGFEYLTAQYVAVGGAQPKLGDVAANLDIYARILKEEPEPKDAPSEAADPETNAYEGDVKFALVKFDVTIKHTQVESGEIVFRIDLNNLWGRDRDWPDGQGGTVDKPQAIFVRGTIPRQVKKGDGDKAPPSFEFACWFDPVFRAQIEVAFVNSFVFRSIRVGRYNGSTALEVDGTVNIRPDVEQDGIPIPIKLGDGDLLPIDLKDFRIIVPKLPRGGKIDFGIFRKLNFDFPSVRFKVPKPRAMNFLGIEIIPQRLGFVRRIGPALQTSTTTTFGSAAWIFRRPATSCSPTWKCRSTSVSYRSSAAPAWTA